MKFENSAPDGGSYEKPKPRKYLGVLVGVSACGTQPSNNPQYPPKPKVMLRWELHKRKGPSKDSKDFIHTATQTYGATVRGENSLLRKALAAHGIVIPEKGATDSKDWLGRCAWLDLQESEDGKYVNVMGVSPLDPEEDKAPEPVMAFEHWDPEEDQANCPGWAAWAVGRSLDLSHRAPKFAKSDRQQPATAGAVSGGPAGGYRNPPADDDDDSIPF